MYRSPTRDIDTPDNMIDYIGRQHTSGEIVV
jgi:hypothetical protein